MVRRLARWLKTNTKDESLGGYPLVGEPSWRCWWGEHDWQYLAVGVDNGLACKRADCETRWMVPDTVLRAEITVPLWMVKRGWI